MTRANIETLARDLCVSVGDDPDAIVIPSWYALAPTAAGHRLVPPLDRCSSPLWHLHVDQARALLEAGWSRSDGVKHGVKP